MRRILSLIIGMLMPFGLMVTSYALLIDRGNGLIYDTELNITWLQDANYAYTSGYNLDGLMTWDDAIDWAKQLVYQGYDGWRLPTALNPDGTGPDVGLNVTGSEMGHLFYVAPPNGLGNSSNGGYGGRLVNTGPFNNIQPGVYWSGTAQDVNPANAWWFNFDTGNQAADPGTRVYYAWAVRDGYIVNIDILPNDNLNIINVKSSKKIPVVILSSLDFIAPSIVDQASLTFGRTGGEHSLLSCRGQQEDVNGDYLVDLLCQFSSKVAGFQCGDIVGILRGKTIDGRLFEGRQLISSTTCK